MADRRMFSKTIIDSDAFLDMPLSAQCLYFHLSMRADDDGFVNNPKKIQRMIGASDDDFKLLIMKQFVLVFDAGIIVIKHWRMHNYIRSDRYKPTAYQKEKRMLVVTDNGSYDWQSDGSQSATECLPVGIPNGNQMDTQVRLGKVRLGKVSIVKGRSEADEIETPFGDDDSKPEPVTVEAYAAHNLKYLSPNNMAELVSFKEDMDDDLIIYAIDKACEQGKRSYSYVKRILNGYIDDGIKTVGEAKASDEEFQKAKQAKAAKEDQQFADKYGGVSFLE